MRAFILFVLKKDSGFRLYINYRDRNKVTNKNRYILPLITKTLNRLYSIKRYSKVDYKDTYYRLRIKKGNNQKTAF